jgi:hypothetical protein
MSIVGTTLGTSGVGSVGNLVGKYVVTAAKESVSLCDDAPQVAPPARVGPAPPQSVSVNGVSAKGRRENPTAQLPQVPVLLTSWPVMHQVLAAQVKVAPESDAKVLAARVA